MPRPKKIPEGRRNHIAIGVSAEYLHKLDEMRRYNPKLSEYSDGQLTKRLAEMALDSMLGDD